MDSGHLYSFWHRKSGRFSGSLAEGGEPWYVFKLTDSRIVAGVGFLFLSQLLRLKPFPCRKSGSGDSP